MWMGWDGMVQGWDGLGWTEKRIFTKLYQRAYLAHTSPHTQSSPAQPSLRPSPAHTLIHRFFHIYCLAGSRRRWCIVYRTYRRVELEHWWRRFWFIFWISPSGCVWVRAVFWQPLRRGVRFVVSSSSLCDRRFFALPVLGCHRARFRLRKRVIR
jgi:hypothetical protein